MLQVKLRGMRVELGEIESALVDAPGVQLATVLVLSDPAGAQRVVAYVTPASVDTAAVLSSVRSRLPAHMVPNVIVLLAVMPLSPTGKVDRKALPEPEWSSVAAEEYVAPISELEKQLQAIFHEVLGQQRVSTQADFFAVGGNSLQVSSRMESSRACAVQFALTQARLPCRTRCSRSCAAGTGSEADDARAQGHWPESAHVTAVCHAHHRRLGRGARPP